VISGQDYTGIGNDTAVWYVDQHCNPGHAKLPSTTSSYSLEGPLGLGCFYLLCHLLAVLETSDTL